MLWLTKRKRAVALHYRQRSVKLAVKQRLNEIMTAKKSVVILLEKTMSNGIEAKYTSQNCEYPQQTSLSLSNCSPKQA